MTKRQEEQKIVSLSQILKKTFPVDKASTIGIIIDATSIYKAELRNVYITRLKVIDHTFNFNTFNPYIQCKYLTIYFESNQPATFPRPRFIGDIIYLRRFKFKLYNQQLQAFQYRRDNHKSFCSWYLISGNFDQQDCLPYGTNKEHFMLKDYQNVLTAVKLLRSFSKEYQSNQSIISIYPPGFQTKDQHYIARVLNRSVQGYLLDIDGDQVFLEYIESQVAEGHLAKLSNVVRIDKNKKGIKQVISSKLTSLVAIYSWSYEAKSIQKLNVKVKQDKEEEFVFTKLSQLKKIYLINNRDNFVYVKVEVAEILPTTFKQAIEIQQNMQNRQVQIIFKEQQNQIQFIYNIKFICMDQDFHQTHQFYEIFLYSQNQIGANLIERINLQEIGPYSSFVQEQMLYKSMRQQLLGSKSVKIKIQILEDTNMNRIFRLVDIYHVQ